MEFLRKRLILVLLYHCTAVGSVDDFGFSNIDDRQVDYDYTELLGYESDPSFLSKYCNFYCDGFERKTSTAFEFEFIPRCIECSCDQHCELLGDCCPDAHGNVRPRQPDLNGYICVVNTPDVKVMDLLGIAMLLTCGDSSRSYNTQHPEGWSSGDMQELFPVTSLVTNISYYNQHIAMCNGETSVVLWDEEVECSSGYSSGLGAYDDVDDVDVDADNCQYTFTASSRTHPRLCDPTVYKDSVDTCNITGLWTEFDKNLVTNCHGPNYPVEFNHTVYRNIFCFLCNGFRPTMIVRDITVGSVPPRITIITRFKEWPNANVYREDDLCKENRLWDPVKKMCRQLYCPSGRTLKNEVCLPDNVDAFGNIYLFDVILRPRDQRAKAATRDWTLMTYMMMSYFESKMSELRSTNFMFTISVDSSSVLRLSCTLLITEHANRIDLEERLVTLVSGEWETTFNDNYYVFFSSVGTEDEPDFTNTATFWSDPVSGMCCNLVSNSFELKHLDESVIPDTITVTEHLTCPYVKIDAEDIASGDTNGWINLVYANVSLPKKYVSFLSNGDVGVCVDILMAAYNGSGLSGRPLNVEDFEIENMLSFVCVTVSLICLLATFVTYCVFPSLRTLPAKNNMFLVAYLFFAQLLFQLGIGQTQHHIVCSSIGIVIHYLWLNVVLWMNVCSFHMFRVFVLTPGRPMSSLAKSKHFIRYILYTNVVSLVIIGLTIGVSMVISQGKELGYGGHACYLSSPIFVGFAFVLPLAVVLCSNILFFGVTVYYISRIEHVKSQTGKERQNIYVYVKLSTLTGMFWTVSILSEYLDIKALTYIAIVLNGSQGLLIFVCYALNRRVLTLWKGICTNIIETYSPNSNKNTTDTTSV